MDFLHRVWAEIDLDALEYNYKTLRARLHDGCRMMCIVKADAYGHGALTVSKTLDRCGAEWFGVSNIEEAAELRLSGIQKPVFILGYTPPGYAGALAEMKLSQSVFSLDYARELDRAAREAGVSVDVHIKIDTGMNRLGLIYQEQERRAETIEEAETICRLKNLRATGMFTHFSVADEGEDGEAFTREQCRCFQEVRDALKEKGITFSFHHCANSGGTLAYPEAQFDMVRPGIALYGLYPSEKLRSEMPLRPVMTLKSVISFLKEVKPGGAVSYGRTFEIERPMTLATIPIGYADGYARSLSGRADLLVGGRRAKIVGRVCMDQLVVDVTGIPGLRADDEVIVFGGGLPVDELARLEDTINYELVCRVSKRVPRIYRRGGQPLSAMNYLCPEAWEKGLL